MRKTRQSKAHFRIITALLLVILMAFSILPLSAFALEADLDNTENTPNSEVQAELEDQDDDTERKSDDTADGSNTPTDEDKDKSGDAGTPSDDDQSSTGEAGDSNTSTDENENKDKSGDAGTTSDDDQPSTGEAGDGNTSKSKVRGKLIEVDEDKTEDLDDDLEVQDIDISSVGDPQERLSRFIWMARTARTSLVVMIACKKQEMP